MYIKKRTWQIRRDFKAILICEHCGNEQLLKSGYDDSYYHQNVIPKIKCIKCDKTANSNYIAENTKYPDGLQL